MVLAVVVVDHRQLAAGAVMGRIVLGHRPARRPADAGRIVGAGDGDDDVLAGAVVRRGHRQLVGGGDAGAEKLDLGIVERVAPLPGGRVEGEGAVAARQRARRGKMVLAAVVVYLRRLPPGAVLFPYAPLFRSARRPADAGRIVGAGDGDDDVLAGAVVR